MWRSMSLRIMLAVTIGACISAPALGQSKGHNPDDVAMELIGQVTATPTSGAQVGYLSYINGLDYPIFSGSPENETTAYFTFAADEVTSRVINNGPLRIINRESGNLTIYYDDTPDGDFANSGTFRDGQAVMTASVRHQVILNFAAGTFTATFVLTVSSNDPFEINGQKFRMGKVGDKHRFLVQGNGLPPAPLGYIAGFIVGDSLLKPEN